MGAQCKWGDRSFMNMQEQSVLFFVPLWLMATVVDPARAASLGWAYLFLRVLYPVIWLLLHKNDGGPPIPHIMLSTFPQYAINVWMAANVVASVNGTDLAAVFFGSDIAGVVVFFVGYLMFAMGFTMKMAQAVYPKFFPKDASLLPGGQTSSATKGKKAGT